MTIGDRVQVKDAPDIIGVISRMNGTHVQLYHRGITIATYPIKDVILRNDLIDGVFGYFSMKDITKSVTHRTYIC